MRCRMAPRSLLRRLHALHPLVAPVLLWAVPCWVLLYAGQHWPLPVTVAATCVFVLGLVTMPFAMVRGHGKRQQDRAAILGDSLLGSVWVLFTWSVLLGVLLRLALTVAGVGDGQDRARIVTWSVLAVAAVLLAWGYTEARRVPRVQPARCGTAAPGSRAGRHPGRPDHGHPLRAAGPGPLVGAGLRGGRRPGGGPGLPHRGHRGRHRRPPSGPRPRRSARSAPPTPAST